MPSFDDVRRIAFALPDAVASEDGAAFRVDGKLFAWPWLVRVDPKKARVPNLDVLVVRVASVLDKEALIGVDPAAFFTEPHDDGYAAILIRLPVIDHGMLEKLITDSWRLKAPRRVREWQPSPS